MSLAVTLLCFTRDQQRAVGELTRVTRPGGRVGLAELGRHSLWAAWRRAKGWRGSDTWKDAQFFTPDELAALLRHAGTHEVRTRPAAYLPPGAPSWLQARAIPLERRARRLGSLGRSIHPRARRGARRVTCRPRSLRACHTELTWQLELAHGPDGGPGAAIESMNSVRFARDTLERCDWEAQVADVQKAKGLAHSAQARPDRRMGAG